MRFLCASQPGPRLPRARWPAAATCFASPPTCSATTGAVPAPRSMRTFPRILRRRRPFRRSPTPSAILGPALRQMRPATASSYGWLTPKATPIAKLRRSPAWSASIRLLLFRARRKIAGLLRGQTLNLDRSQDLDSSPDLHPELPPGGNHDAAKLLARKGSPGTGGAGPLAPAPARNCAPTSTSAAACGDLVLSAEPSSRRVRRQPARPSPRPGLLWWRAQLRRRNWRRSAIGKPLLGAQIFALAFTLSLAAGFVVWQVRQGLAWHSWIGQIRPAHMPNLAGIWSLALQFRLEPVVLVPILATVTLLSGVVVYLAAEKQ